MTHYNQQLWNSLIESKEELLVQDMNGTMMKNKKPNTSILKIINGPRVTSINFT